jgi:long-chain acyl-CoA synthetase
MSLLTDHLRLGPVNFRGKTYPPHVVIGQIDAVAAFLDQHCQGRSPIVYLFATNHIKTVAGYFGIIKSGRVCLLADPATRALEWAEMTRDAPTSAVIRFDESTDTLDLNREITLYENVLDQEAERELEGVCTLLYTAADDGYAKAAMLTHQNILANATSVVECNELDKTTPSCSAIPFSHLFAIQSGLVAPALAGSPTCIVAIEPLSRVRAISAELQAGNVARLQTVPAIFYILGKSWKATSAPHIPEVLVSGGSKLPLSLTQHYRHTFGRDIREGYGLTEAAPICTWHRPLDQVRPDSVGRAFTCCELRIEDDRGSTVSTGSVGEVCVRGANVMKGYFHHQSATSRALRGGWLHTGDLGRLDADGFLYLTGLKKRMLNIAGQKVYPAEVERLMRCNPNVEFVNISGRPQEMRGETVCGTVKLRHGGDEAQRSFAAWCSQNISAFKIPSRIQYEQHGTTSDRFPTRGLL